MSKIKPHIIKLDASNFQLTKVSSSLIKKLADKFSYLPPGYKFNPAFRLRGINGVKVKMVQPTGVFPAGLFSDIVTYLTETLNKEVTMSNDVMEHWLPINDLTPSPIDETVFSDYEFDDNPVLLRDYQLGAVNAAFENRNGILNLSTGAGKCLGGDTEVTVKISKELAEKYKLI